LQWWLLMWPLAQRGRRDWGCLGIRGESANNIVDHAHRCLDVWEDLNENVSAKCMTRMCQQIAGSVQKSACSGETQLVFGRRSCGNRRKKRGNQVQSTPHLSCFENKNMLWLFTLRCQRVADCHKECGSTMHLHQAQGKVMRVFYYIPYKVDDDFLLSYL
jgi:hypothetical protein